MCFKLSACLVLWLKKTKQIQRITESHFKGVLSLCTRSPSPRGGFMYRWDGKGCLLPFARPCSLQVL